MVSGTKQFHSLCPPPNKQLQRTVRTASRYNRQRAAAELRRYATS